MTLIMQFNDTIVSSSLNGSDWTEWCEPTAMVRRHPVRGYQDQVYFVETSGNSQKVYKLELHANKVGEVTKKEVYQLAGNRIAAFETDCENIQDDTKDGHVK